MLVVDDEALLAQTLATALRRAGHVVEIAATAADALEKLATGGFDVVLTDVYMPPDKSGFRVLEAARTSDLPIPVLVMSGRSEVALAVAAMRAGATDFIEKPFDLAEVVLRVRRALETATMQKRLRALESAMPERNAAIAASPGMRRAFALADRVAASPGSSALILGESGVGKEVVAARIHESSRRRLGPFVKVNLAAIPESMVESELFGSVRGAFTDSKRDRAGHLATADGGTLLLDELCEFRADLQPKLLRVLEEREFYPVGSDRPRAVNLRILAATNREPHEAIASGRLRADLYYRLSPLTIHIPPLRERLEDILPLARYFVSRLSADFGRRAPQLLPETERALLDHRWPGNVRELRNVIERALMLTDGEEIETSALGLSPRAGAAPHPSIPPPTPQYAPPTSTTLPTEAARESSSRISVLPTPRRGRFPARQSEFDELERRQIASALEAAGGSRMRAAQLLGISRTTLWEKAKRYGLA